jgi:energy-coupling factor transporter ATP-binding protein EcfA2
MSVPKDQQDKRQFLEDLATQYKFYGDTRTAFLGRFAPENADKLNNQLVLTWTKDLDNKEQKLQDELRKIYPVLRENGYDIPETQRGRYKKGESPWEIVYEWLWEVEFPEWKQAQTEPEKPSEILKRCVLGLKGNYQEAQQKITEITQHLQTFLKDNSLSITVEEGSIIIIVESSQTDYDQIKKRLIGQEIAGFAVEYVIDEWQDVCRRMLKKQTQLSVNNLLKAQFNRNLIEEELFIDLALVQPKRDRNEQHQQNKNNDPDRGSQFYTQQEVEKRFAYSEFLQEVISQRKQKNIAIIGEPGAGKTTLLQKLAFWLLQETDDLVIWISLGELGEKPLGDYLQEKWLKDALMDTRDEIKADWEQKFKRGAVWLLLDGLDEMGDTARQSLKFQGWVTQAQLIISCRLNLWQANPSQLQDFKTYLTQPFQDEQIQQFIQRWFRNLSGEKPEGKLAESLWSALQTSGKERIKDLCRNPLRLTLLSSIWQDEKGNLPDTTAELYQSFVEYIYKWKKKEFPMKKAERDSLNAGLGELGKASLDCEEIRFRLTHRFVCKYLGEPDENSLFDSALKLGWLNEVGVAAENPRERVYAFYHATFQEYFAALAVADWDYFLPRNHVNFPVAGKEYRIFESQWKQIILLWLGRDIASDKKEEFIRELVNFEDGFTELEHHNCRGLYEYQAYFLAAAGINEFKPCSLALDIARQVVQWGFGKFNIEKQEWQTFLDPIEEGATKAIPETIRPLAITEIIKIIENCPDEDIRKQAAASLGKIDPGNPQVITALVKLIENTEDEDIRREAAESLGKIDPENPQAIAALVKVIENNEYENARFWAAKSLGEIDPGNPQAIAALAQVIENTEDEDIRREAAESLGKIDPENPQAIAAFAKVIENNEYENARFWAAASLGKIDPEDPQAIAALAQVIENTEDQSTFWLAAESLGEIGQGNPQAIAALVKVIKNTEDVLARLLAAYSLQKILTTPEQYVGVASALKDCLSDEVYQNNFNRFYQCYQVIWYCAANLPYPQFYQAWHHPPTTPHPEVPDQTPVGNNSTVENLETQQLDLSLQLQNLPIFCLNAYILATETDTSEIAQTLCQLIWDEAFPDGDYPEEVTTASKLREHLKKLKLTRNQPKLNLLLTHCEHPTDELIAFCHKLTNILSIAWLTDKSLEAPLKGFPPHQPNLLSAIQTWLEEA